jgi:MFS family permease
VAIYIIGQLVAVFTPTLAGLYASRIISGWGIGSLTVTGPMSIVEISPPQVRGLLAAWFNVAMGLALTSAVFCVYGVYAHIPESRLQYQVVFFSPCVFMFLCVIASFWLCESPRWLILADRHDEAESLLVKLRGLPSDDPRVSTELAAIQDSVQHEKIRYAGSSHFISILKETFTIPANLRRVQQSLVSYGLAQLSGANSITSYFVPILTLLGIGGGTKRNLFLTGMYGFSKLWFSMIASFLLIDTIGRRKSLFLGASLQMVSDIYVGVYLKYKQEGETSDGASKGAIAFIFIHAFGYVAGT